MIDKLREIELKFKVEKLNIKGVSLWPYLRIILGNHLTHKESKYTKKNKKLSFLKKIKYFSNILYGIHNCFKNGQVVFFATSKERKKLGDKFISKNIYPYYKKFNKALLVEHPYDGIHQKYSTVYEKNIISLSIFQVFSKLLSKFINLKGSVSGESVLEELDKELPLGINYEKLSHDYYLNYLVYKFFFKFKKTHTIFISVYYGYGPVVKAAKDLGIKVIEIQHGIIHPDHYAYNVFKDIDSNSYPDYFCVNGSLDVDSLFFFSENFFIKKQNIIQIGNYFLENYNQDFKISYTEFTNYTRKVCFSASLDNEREELDILNKIAINDPKTLYVYVPRRVVEDELLQGYQKNIIIQKDFNCYEIILNTDIHMSIESTCALEAGYFGKKTLFLDTNKKKYSKVLEKFDTIFTNIKEPSLAVEEIDKMLKIEDIAESVFDNFRNYSYKSNVENNINNFLKEIGLYK